MSGLSQAWRLLRWRELRIAGGSCPFCGPTLLLRLACDELAVRCARCGASAVHISLGWAMRHQAADLQERIVCELSARGPLAAFLLRLADTVCLSEFCEGAVPGSMHGGVRCEDVQQLSYADASFDLCTSTEVLEHVPDDARAFAELHRVLKPGGVLLFTVPLTRAETTLERARLENGQVRHLHPPMHHGDPLRPGQGILCYRDYGRDIGLRLLAAGFAEAAILPPDPRIPWSAAREVVYARRAANHLKDAA